MATQAEIAQRLPKVLGLRLLGYTEQQIADTLGVSQPTIADDLKVRIPSVDELKEVSQQAIAVHIANIPEDVSWQAIMSALCSVLRIDPQLTEERINELVDARINSQQTGRPTPSGEGIQQPLDTA